jgi:hypothetical protein
VVQFQIKAAINGNVPQKLVAGKRGALMGSGDVQTGDPEFDKKIFVQCPDQAGAQAFLTPQRREALYRVAKLGGVVMGPTEETYAMVARSQPGYKVDFDWLDGKVQEYTSIAKELDG